MTAYASHIWVIGGKLMHINPHLVILQFSSNNSEGIV